MAGFQTLAVVTPATRASAVDVVPDRLAEAGRQVGISIVSVVAGADAHSTLAALPEGADAAYFTPLLRFSEENRAACEGTDRAWTAGLLRFLGPGRRAGDARHQLT